MPHTPHASLAVRKPVPSSVGPLGGLSRTGQGAGSRAKSDSRASSQDAAGNGAGTAEVAAEPLNAAAQRTDATDELAARPQSEAARAEPRRASEGPSSISHG